MIFCTGPMDKSQPVFQSQKGFLKTVRSDNLTREGSLSSLIKSSRSCLLLKSGSSIKGNVSV